MSWKYFNPAKIYFTDNFALQIFEIISIFKKQKILIITYDWFKKTEYYQKLKEKVNSFHLFNDIEENPSFNSCQIAINEARKINPNIIIAIGGGSVIDTAKAVRSSLYKNCFDIKDLFKTKNMIGNKPIFIAIPTTHGTGSELTMWATIWDKKNKKKYSLSEFENYPDYAVYDVNLLKDLPIKISIITTLDTLSHAFESIWNKNRNPISTEYAVQAIRLVYNNIEGINENTSIDTRKNLMMASMYAGLAFSNTKTAAAHSISYPLTLYYSIPHGIACSMTLFSLLKINYESIQNEINEILHFLGLDSIEKMWEKIICSVNTKIPFTICEYGIKEEDLTWLVEKSFTKDRMRNNIINLDKNNVLNILKEIYE